MRSGAAAASPSLKHMAQLAVVGLCVGTGVCAGEAFSLLWRSEQRTTAVCAGFSADFFTFSKEKRWS